MTEPERAFFFFFLIQFNFPHNSTSPGICCTALLQNTGSIWGSKSCFSFTVDTFIAPLPVQMGSQKQTRLSCGDCSSVSTSCRQAASRETLVSASGWLLRHIRTATVCSHDLWLRSWSLRTANGWTAFKKYQEWWLLGSWSKAERHRGHLNGATSSVEPVGMFFSHSCGFEPHCISLDIM